MVPATQLAERVGRDIRDDVCRGPLDVGGDELCGQPGGVAEPALLPGANERARRAVVGDRRAGGGKRQPASRALATVGDRPRGGRAAVRTARRAKRPERTQAGRAERLGSGATTHATTRQDEVDEPRDPRYDRSCDVSVPELKRKRADFGGPETPFYFDVTASLAVAVLPDVSYALTMSVYFTPFRLGTAQPQL